MQLHELKNQSQLTDVRVIAHGGMSIIYRAYQPNMQRDVVIKILKPEISRHNDVLERFRREAQAMGRVLHQNVAHVYDFVDQGRDSYLIMEHINGVDLSELLSKYGALDAEVAVAITMQILRGLKFIHSRNYLHRDVKPSNIRLTNKGNVKLMDFGIALSTVDNGLTRPGTMVGSPCYLSPEQILGEKLGPTSDLFLVGICLYEMLTGNRPFQDEGGPTVFHKIRDARYVPIRKMRSTVPQPLANFVERLLEREPSKRYPTADQALEALENSHEALVRSGDRTIRIFLETEAFVEIDPSESVQEWSAPPISPQKPHKTASKAKPLLWAALAAFGFIAGFYFARTDFRESPKPPEKLNIRPITK